MKLLVDVSFANTISNRSMTNLNQFLDLNTRIFIIITELHSKVLVLGISLISSNYHIYYALGKHTKIIMNKLILF